MPVNNSPASHCPLYLRKVRDITSRIRAQDDKIGLLPSRNRPFLIRNTKALCRGSRQHPQNIYRI
jgi:hypothetical protein